MTSKQLNKLFFKAKIEYLCSIVNDRGIYTCQGCDCDFTTIEIHHIIKRSKLKYYYADPGNFIELCPACHRKAEGTIQQQEQLYCYYEMFHTEQRLLKKYYRLKPYEQTLLWKYGNK